MVGLQKRPTAIARSSIKQTVLIDLRASSHESRSIRSSGLFLRNESFDARGVLVQTENDRSFANPTGVFWITPETPVKTHSNQKYECSFPESNGGLLAHNQEFYR